MNQSYNATIPPLLFEWEGPMIIKSEANMREHFWKVKKRRDQQKYIINSAIAEFRTETALPCIISLTRLYPRLCDSDNLQISFKFIRDHLASIVIPGKAAGRADNDPRLSWEYKQEKSKLKGCRIQIYKVENAT